MARLATIDKGGGLLTLIITLEVEPGQCDALVALIKEETLTFVRHQPGFVSCNLHRDAESTRIVNYGQWASRELYEQARSREEFKAFSRRVEALARRIEPVPYEVIFTETA
jgi:quinol monooxygenase YgiN